MKDVLKRKEIEFDWRGEHFKVTFEEVQPRWNDRKSHMRAYVTVPKALQPSDTHLDELAEKLGADSKWTQKGDYPELDKAWQKFNREEVKQMRNLLEEGIAHLRSAGWLECELHITFSKTAGCSCGCSPGFVVKGKPGTCTIWVGRYNAKEEEERRAEYAKQREERLAKTRIEVEGMMKNFPIYDLNQTQLDKVKTMLLNYVKN